MSECKHDFDSTVAVYLDQCSKCGDNQYDALEQELQALREKLKESNKVGTISYERADREFGQRRKLEQELQALQNGIWEAVFANVRVRDIKIAALVALLEQSNE